jgi:hypothetical protein
MSEKTKIYYTTKGSVRGCCGHKHRYLHSAVKCVLNDRRDCLRVRGYSDRSVVRWDGGEMTEEDYDAIRYYMYEEGR